MQSLKILTFNWHDPYIYLFGQTAQDITVCDWMRRADGTQGWDYQKRPLRDNLHLIKDPSEAIAGLQAGEYDLAVAHTLQDIRFLNDYDVPAIYLTHNALHNDGMNNKVAMTQIRGVVAEFVNRPNRVFVAISQMKMNSWGLDGHVIPPGIDVADYGGYTGEKPVALAVGNLFVERDFMLGYSVLSEALESLSHQFVGENPSLPEARKAESWADLKAFYRSHRLYANATVEAFEDGYNLGMLEAMATGMPVVTMKNATSPIVDGVNGYVCKTGDAFRERVSELLDHAELARSLGESARKTVEEDFSVETFVTGWMQAFDQCLSGCRVSVSTNGDLRLAVSPADLYAYDAQDVQRFLAVPDKVVVAKAKIDRYGGALMIDFVLVNADTGEQAVWAGFQAQVAGDKLNVEFPPYLATLREDIRKQIEQVLVVCVEEARKPEYADIPQLHVNLGNADSLVFRVGDDRITPGDVRADVYLHHAKRYGFASQFCAGKDVVDVASGTGYGSKILSRHANRVLALDLEADPLRYGRLTFDAENISRSNADMRALPIAADTADTVICFEAIEHITEHRDFLREVHRVLREDGQFVVSTPNLDIYGLPENDNPFHVGMLSESDFTNLLSEFFEDVVCVSQERASGQRAFYDYFNFTDDPNADKEIHVAVCSKPKELSGRAGAGKRAVKRPSIPLGFARGRLTGRRPGLLGMRRFP